MFNGQELAESFESSVTECEYEDPGKELQFLYLQGFDTGVVASVYEIGGNRYYHASEYTQDGEETTESCGYVTMDKGCMGQRYRGLFGEFESEVFNIIK